MIKIVFLMFAITTVLILLAAFLRQEFSFPFWMNALICGCIGMLAFYIVGNKDNV